MIAPVRPGCPPLPPTTWRRSGRRSSRAPPGCCASAHPVVGRTEGAEVVFGAHDPAVAWVRTHSGRGRMLDEAQLLGPRCVEDVGGVGSVMGLDAGDPGRGELALPTGRRRCRAKIASSSRPSSASCRCRASAVLNRAVLSQPGSAERVAQPDRSRGRRGRRGRTNRPRPDRAGRARAVRASPASGIDARRTTRVVDEVLRQRVRVRRASSASPASGPRRCGLARTTPSVTTAATTSAALKSGLDSLHRVRRCDHRANSSSDSSTSGPGAPSPPDCANAPPQIAPAVTWNAGLADIGPVDPYEAA